MKMHYVLMQVCAGLNWSKHCGKRCCLNCMYGFAFHIHTRVPRLGKNSRHRLIYIYGLENILFVKHMHLCI